MSGHSKWSTIKRQKGVADARRGQLFTKLTKEIIVAAREGGGDPTGNFRLRLAIQKARDNNMPLDNVDRAIKKGTGELEGASLTDVVLEGYGPGGTAILVQALSDNRNRTIQEIRHAFSKYGGNLGESGCVAWLFKSQGVITVPVGKLDADEVGLQAIDAGADDVKVEKDYLEIYTAPELLEAVREALKKSKIEVESAEVATIANTTVELEEKEALQALKLLDKIEEIDDVQSVSSNADFSDAIIEKYDEQS
jgi:YebC/PmpR family DNA-binding regulatory protein